MDQKFNYSTRWTPFRVNKKINDDDYDDESCIKN
jgi:hypothetical protein